MYVSRLKRWYSVNKVSIGTIDNIYWGVISAKTFLSDLATEITFGWWIVEVIASFEWSSSIFKCKCNHLNGKLLYSNGRCYLNGQLLYPNVNVVIWMVNLNGHCYLNGELLYSNVNAFIWMVNFYIQMDTAIWIGELLYPNVNAVIWMVNFYIQV